MTNHDQTSLFNHYEGVSGADTTNIVKSFSINESADDNPALRKLKRNFNHRLKAIKKLNEDLEKLPLIFASLNAKYNERVKPVEEHLYDVKKKTIELLDKVYGKKSFTNSEREKIRMLMVEALNSLTEYGAEYDDRYNKYFALDELMDDEESMELIQDMMSSMMGKTWTLKMY